MVIVLLCLCSCRDKANTFQLEGHISSLSHDTLYIYGADALYEHIDTVVTADGAFRYTTTVDTVTPLWVLFPNNHREMLFADKRLKCTLFADTALAGHVCIMGGAQNALLQEFHSLIAGVTDKHKIVTVADSFIRANPYAEVSLHLLREYFVNQPSPEYTKIKTLIGSMSGNLQDNNYIRSLQPVLSAYKPLAKNSVVNNFNVRDSEGKYVATTEYKDTYLLLTFWASWDEESRQRQRELVALKAKYEDCDFDILSISLDTDRDTWLQAIAADSATWRQACDLDGWNTGLVQRLQVTHLPTNVLLNPSRRILAVDLYGEELDTNIAACFESKQPDGKEKKSPDNIRAKKKK